MFPSLSPMKIGLWTMEFTLSLYFTLCNKKEWSERIRLYLGYEEWSQKWGSACAFRRPHTCGLKVWRVLFTAACSLILASVHTLKKAKWSKQLGLSDPSKLFPLHPLMLPSVNSVEPQLYVVSWVVPTLEEWKLERFIVENGLEVFGLRIPEEEFFFWNPNHSLWLRSLIHKAVGGYPNTGTLSGPILVTINPAWCNRQWGPDYPGKRPVRYRIHWLRYSLSFLDEYC